MRHTLLMFLLACNGIAEPRDDTSGLTGESFACGTETCAADEFCYTFIGGVPDTDGNATQSTSCEPASCPDGPSCACLASTEECSIECDESGPGVHCTVAAP